MNGYSYNDTVSRLAQSAPAARQGTAPAAQEPPADAAGPEEMAEFLVAMLERTRADVATANRAEQAGAERTVFLQRSSVRLTDRAVAALRGRVEELIAEFGEPGADPPAGDPEVSEDPAVWTGLLVSMVDLRDRQARLSAVPPGGRA
ncbi:MAG: hypothetical protein ACRDRL_24765 [Sciscionella sp.]